MAAVIADQATLTGMTTYKGFDSVTIETPALEIVAVSAQPGLPEDEGLISVQLGNWGVELAVRIRTSVDDTTRAAAAVFVGEVRDVLIQDSLVGDINTLAAVTDFTALAWFPGECTREIDEETNQRICEQTGVLYCKPS